MPASTTDTTGVPPVPVIGASGDLGLGLALRWAAAGVPVVIGSRDAGRAREAAERVSAAVPGAEVAGMANADAAAAGPVVALCVPFAAQLPTLASLSESLVSDALLVDCSVPLATAVGGRPTHSLGVWHGSAAQQAQQAVPDGVSVVGAFHTVSAATLADLEHPLAEDVLLCGQRKADKARVAALVERIPGLRAVNAGSLETARIVEQLTPLLISVNSRYRTH
ncbi:MAG TPA: NADPH-dependent F420 reductase, partial [Solirubrobacterales bacterium]|nr:NADPH-dependent F420 reductase [Solirubrobacterales bacterium]